MSVEPEIVVEQIDRALQVLQDMETFLDDRLRLAPVGRAPDRAARMVVAQILENVYTAAETAFLRISQRFENSLGVPAPALRSAGQDDPSDRGRQASCDLPRDPSPSLRADAFPALQTLLT